MLDPLNIEKGFDGFYIYLLAVEVQVVVCGDDPTAGAVHSGKGLQSLGRTRSKGENRQKCTEYPLMPMPMPIPYST